MNFNKTQKCGYITDLNYNKAVVLTDDSLIKKVGGLEKGAFLVAETDTEMGPKEYILLRIEELADLIDDATRTQIKNDTFSNELAKDSGADMNLDGIDDVDPYTKEALQKQGYECRVLGTFYYDENDELQFGNDMQQIFSGSKYEVFKPVEGTLQKIINYSISSGVRIGKLSYTQTKNHREVSKLSNIPAKVNLDDFVGDKTALFGMTRTGKSNSIKILASALHKAQLDTSNSTEFNNFGQLIVDASGEYAHNNDQDDIPISVLPNSVVYTGRNTESLSDTYKSITDDLYRTENLGQLKSIILGELQGEDSDYVQEFKTGLRNIEDSPQPEDYVKNERMKSVLYAILAQRDLETDQFNYNECHCSVIKPKFEEKANPQDSFFGSNRNGSVVRTDWEQKINTGNKYTYVDFDEPSEQLQFWKDVNQFLKSEDIEPEEVFSTSVVNLFNFLCPDGASGSGKISDIKEYHNKNSQDSTENKLYSLLESGKLVILDLSAGQEEYIKQKATNSIRSVYEESMKRFRENENLPPIQIYLEEAHRHFDTDTQDEQNIYVRMAKEGGKLDIGFVYATQEVSSIDYRVLSNTANWVITHLNNEKEINELVSFYDFDDFKQPIRKVDQSGFAKLLTKSHEYTVPIRVSEFDEQYLTDSIGFDELDLSIQGGNNAL